MTRREQLTRYAEEHDLELIFFGPPEVFDPAILGLVYGFGQDPAVLYDEALVMRGLTATGMDHHEAQEFFDYNTIGAGLGEATPRFLMRMEEDDGEQA